MGESFPAPTPDMTRYDLPAPQASTMIEVPESFRVKIEPEPSNNVAQPMIEFPFERNNKGDFVRKLEDSDRLSIGATIGQLRDRLAKPEMLSEDESKVVLREVAAFTNDAIKTGDHHTDVFTRDIATFALFYLDVQHKAGGKDNSVTMQNGEASLLTIDPHTIENETESLMRLQEVQWRHPGDARLVANMGVFAHEYGHLFARMAADKIGLGALGKSSDFFKAFLSSNSAHGFTGIFESDPQILDERFANGFGNATIQHVLNALGYSQEEQAAIVRVTSAADYEYGDGRMNHLDAVEHARHRSISIGRAALELAGYESTTLGYEGGLGYRSPLEVTDVQEIVTFAANHVKDQTTPQVMTPGEYRSSFDAQYGGALHPALQQRIDVKDHKGTIG